MSGQIDRSERDQHRLIQSIIDNTPSVIYVKDRAFCYRLINRQFEKLFGISRTDIIGRTDYECFPEELADAFRKNDARVVHTRQSIECEEVAPHEDGLHSYLTLKFPLLDADGNVEAIAGISTDVTERLRTRRELESLKHRYELILGSITDGICGLDGQGNVVYLNTAAERMLGWTVAALRGECRSTIIVPPADFAHQECPVTAVLRGEQRPRITDARFRCRDGRLIPVEYTVSPITEASGIVGVVIAFRDITERIAAMRVEQELRTAHKVQQALYPQRDPVHSGLDVAGISVPSRFACGDYYDFLPTDDGSLVVVVGDVTGHGLGPALEMVGVRASLRAISANETNLGRCMNRLNRVLVVDLPDEMFVTLLIAKFDPSGRSLIYSAAGHEALIVRQDQSVQRLNSTGLVLGLDDNARFDVSAPIPLSPGDIVLIPTDGLIESMAPDHQMFGWDRAAVVINNCREQCAQSILDELRAAAERFCGGAIHHDDVTAVIVKVQP